MIFLIEDILFTVPFKMTIWANYHSHNIIVYTIMPLVKQAFLIIFNAADGDRYCFYVISRDGIKLLSDKKTAMPFFYRTTPKPALDTPVPKQC